MAMLRMLLLFSYAMGPIFKWHRDAYLEYRALAMRHLFIVVEFGQMKLKAVLVLPSTNKLARHLDLSLKAGWMN